MKEIEALIGTRLQPGDLEVVSSPG